MISKSGNKYVFCFFPHSISTACTFTKEWGSKCYLSQNKSGECAHVLLNLSGKPLSQWSKVKRSVAPWKIQPRSNPLNLGRSSSTGGKHFSQHYWKQILCDTHCPIVKCLISSVKSFSIWSPGICHVFGRDKLNEVPK